ncbi:MAG: NUDIX domain-containing protein [Flavobacteriales bacterium]|nr:NUDIX domain-containing protein [Flavobacteriales bacterium]
MYKVFIGDNQITFPKQYSECEGAIFTDPTEETIRGVIQDCFGKGSVKISLFSQNHQELIDIFEKNFQHIPAAGGIVRQNDTEKILFIHRGGLWDLPKGWMEKGETKEQSALREVREETGLTDLKNDGFVYTSRHAYILKGKWALKRTHWYAMTTFATDTTPQIEEGIDQAKWFALDEVETPLTHTYSSIKETFSHYREKYLKL